jgi:hypothetical protein
MGLRHFDFAQPYLTGKKKSLAAQGYQGRAFGIASYSS